MIPAKYWSPTKKLMVLGAMAGGKLVEDTATGNPLTFITDKAKPLKSLLIPFTPQQQGTGDPSPSNIRPILPWNGLSVFGGGKNLLDPSHRNTQGNNAQYYRSGNRFLLKGGQTYTLSANVIPAQITIFKETNTNVASTTSATLTYTPTENVEVWFDFYIPNSRLPEGGISAVYGMLEVGQTATAYEPYKPITETDIVFPSPVYGGTLDVVSGVLTVTHVCLEVKKRDFLQQGQGEMPYRQTPNNYIIQHKPKSGVNWSMARQTQKMECAVIANPYSETTFGNYIGVCLCDVTIPTTFRISMDVYDSMQNDDDSVSICYEIAEPYEITLTPQQITALVGDNTIWSDADGSMTAVYLKKA